ncbi:unnamed protein product, partial [Ectocarpus sp. 12 AP-2014]
MHFFQGVYDVDSAQYMAPNSTHPLRRCEAPYLRDGGMTSKLHGKTDANGCQLAHGDTEGWGRFVLSIC